MVLFLHSLASVAVSAHLGFVFVLLFLEGASYLSLLFLPIPLVYSLLLLGRRISVVLYFMIGAAGTVVLVYGRWNLDLWLPGG